MLFSVVNNYRFAFHHHLKLPWPEWSCCNNTIDIRPQGKKTELFIVRRLVRNAINGLSYLCRLNDWLILTFLINLGMLLRLLQLGYMVFSFDEAIYVLRANLITKLPASFLDLAPGGDVKFPLHSFFIHVAGIILGEGEFSARFTSAIFGTLLIPVVYFLFRRSLDRKFALIGALLVSINPFLIQYSRTALVESGLIFFSFGAILLFLISIDSGKYTLFAIFGACLGILLLLKLSSAVVFLTLLITGPFILLRRLTNKSNLLKNLFSYYFPRYLLAFIIFILTLVVVQYILTKDVWFIFTSSEKTIPRFSSFALQFITDYTMWIRDQLFAYHYQSLLVFAAMVGIVNLIIFNFNSFLKSDLDQIFLVFLPVLILSVFGARAPAPGLYFARYLLPMTIIIIYFALRLVQFQYFQSAIFGKLVCATILLLIGVQAIAGIPSVINNSEYDDYWHIQDYREIGIFLQEHTDKNDVILANTHFPVLKYYSEREVFDCLGRTQETTLHHSYQYGIINPMFQLDDNTTLSLFKYVIITDKYKEKPGITLANTYPQYSDDFWALIKEYYVPVKRLTTTTIYERNDLGNNLVRSTESKIINNPSGEFVVTPAKYTFNIKGNQMSLIFQSYLFDENHVVTLYMLDAPPKQFMDYIVTFSGVKASISDGENSPIRNIAGFSTYYAGYVENEINILSGNGIRDLSLKIDKVVVKYLDDTVTINDLLVENLITSPKALALSEIGTSGSINVFNPEADFNKLKLSTTNEAKGELDLNDSYVMTDDYSLNINYDVSSPVKWSTVWIRKDLTNTLNLSQFVCVRMWVYGDGKQEDLGIDFVDDKGSLTRYFEPVDWIGWKEINRDLKMDATAPNNIPADMSHIKSILFLIDDHNGSADAMGTLYIESVQVIK